MLPPIMTTTHSLTICADDYGLAPGVSQAIRDLILKRRLHATGCMTGSLYWPQQAQLLKPLEGLADFGLHITLTQQTPLAPMPYLAPSGKLPNPDALVMRSWLGRVDRKEVAAEIHRQLDAFEAAMGRQPDFLDGHHHVHHLPIIRDVVLEIWQNRLGKRGWIRSCWESPVALMNRGIDSVRASIISMLGWRWHQMMIHHKVPHNMSFRGVYDLTDKVPFADLFSTFITPPAPRTMVMVHPGFVDTALIVADSLTDQRENEFAFLASDHCAQILTERDIGLTKLF
jgi:hypothetical protein